MPRKFWTTRPCCVNLLWVLFCFCAASSFVGSLAFSTLCYLFHPSGLTTQLIQHAWSRLREGKKKKRLATGRKECSDPIDKLFGGWFPQLFQLKQVKPNCLKPRDTSTPMFRGTWIVVNWSTKGYWTHWMRGHDVYGLYPFSKRKKNEWIKRNIVWTLILYLPIYLLFL